MWPNSNLNNPKEDKFKEYQRQQDRLKAMASTTDKNKAVSADIMIENLLNRTETFKRAVPPVTSPEKPQMGLDLPVWLQCNSSAVPPQYKSIWSLVQNPQNMRSDNSSFADTQKVSQLLLTSGLHTDVLGFIWNMANKLSPGQLSQQELYIVLALVGLAQNGCTFNNLSILNLIPSAPVPVLQVGVIDKMGGPFLPTNVLKDDKHMSCIQTSARGDQSKPPVQEKSLELAVDLNPSNNASYDFFSSFPTTNIDNEKGVDNLPLNSPNQHAVISADIGAGYKNSNFPCIGSSPTAELEADDDFSDFQSVVVSSKPVKPDSGRPMTALNPLDDFTDFQSADFQTQPNQVPPEKDPLEAVVMSQKRDIPKIPLPKSLSGKLTNLKSNILKVSPESERKLKILSQPESLSSLPESKISSSNKVSTMPSIAVVGGSRGIGSRLANHALGTKPERALKHHHKHHKVKLNSEEMIIPTKLIPPAHVDDLFPKCIQKSSGGPTTFILKETKIRSSDSGSATVDLPVVTMKENTFEAAKGFSRETTRKIDIPTLGLINETVLPTQPTQVVQPGSLEFFSVEEDKYSALRDIDFSSVEVSSPPEPTAPAPAPESDDFGDFLSADLAAPPASTTDEWAGWSSSTNPPKDIDLFDLSAESEPVTIAPVEFASALESESSFLPVPISSMSDISGFDVFDPISSVAPPMNLSDALLSLSDIKMTADTANVEPHISLWTDSQTPAQRGEAEKLDWMNAQTQSLQLDINATNSDSDFGDYLTPELKPKVEDNLSRHSSLPSLDLKMSPSDETEQELVGRKCFDSCFNLIQEAFEIFSSVTSKSVLGEVFSSQEAVDYLNNLNIVYHISKRISNSSTDVQSYQDSVGKLWQRLDDYCFEYNIKLKEDEDSKDGSGGMCGVCLGPVSRDFIDQGSVLFHPSCANLWINCVDVCLPGPVANNSTLLQA